MTAFDIALAVMIVITLIRLAHLEFKLSLVDRFVSYYVMATPSEREELVRKVKEMSK